MSGPNYSYTPNTPQGPQLISTTQSPIQNNFAAIDELLSVNHISFDNPRNYGEHNYTSLLLNVADLDTSATEMLLYGKQTPSGPNVGELFYRYPNNGTVVQLTGSVAAAGAATNGYVYISSTNIMKWGLATGILTNTSNVVTFPTVDNIPFASTPEILFVCPAAAFSLSGASTTTTVVTATQFTLTLGAYGSTEYYWMAIGAF